MRDRRRHAPGPPRPVGATPARRGAVADLHAAVGNRTIGRLLGAPTRSLQRDLAAHNKPRSEGFGSMSGSTTIVTTTAEAADLRAALAGLIKADKVKEVTSATGNRSWFAANHHRNAQLDEIRQAFADAGYANAGELARALYDIHGEYLYAGSSMTSYHMLGSHTSKQAARVTRVRNRSLTEYEIRQAKRVFKGAIDYGKVTIAEASLSAKVGSAGGYARTVGNTIYFPEGATRSMKLMVHELTHVWQYQKTGWTYAPKAIWAQITEGYEYWDGTATPEQALRDARAAGRTLGDFNKEQQGDILADYFGRLQGGLDVSAWQPFVDDVK